VPFYGSDGAAIGLRVTGIATESVFATMGLHPGDAIVGLDGDRLTDPGALERRWRTGWRPAEVAVVPADRPLALPDRRRLR
jgi:S1-C subfamily serine protease